MGRQLLAPKRNRRPGLRPMAAGEDCALLGSARAPGKGSLCAQARAFNLQAAARVAANDKPGRQRLCRCILGPPHAHDRLSILDDGAVRLDLKRPWCNGTSAVDLPPLALIARLAALVVPAGPRACHTCPCPTRLRRACRPLRRPSCTPHVRRRGPSGRRGRWKN